MHVRACRDSKQERKVSHEYILFESLYIGVTRKKKCIAFVNVYIYIYIRDAKRERKKKKYRMNEYILFDSVSIGVTRKKKVYCIRERIYIYTRREAREEKSVFYSCMYILYATRSETEKSVCMNA